MYYYLIHFEDYQRNLMGDSEDKGTTIILDKDCPRIAIWVIVLDTPYEVICMVDSDMFFFYLCSLTQEK